MKLLISKKNVNYNGCSCPSCRPYNSNTYRFIIEIDGDMILIATVRGTPPVLSSPYMDRSLEFSSVESAKQYVKNNIKKWIK